LRGESHSASPDVRRREAKGTQGLSDGYFGFRSHDFILPARSAVMKTWPLGWNAMCPTVPAAGAEISLVPASTSNTSRSALRGATLYSCVPTATVLPSGDRATENASLAGNSPTFFPVEASRTTTSLERWPIVANLFPSVESTLYRWPSPSSTSQRIEPV